VALGNVLRSLPAGNIIVHQINQISLKNPHNIPATRFALMAEMKSQAIFCDSELGPCFSLDIRVSDNCNANTRSRTLLGTVYTNDTGLDGMTVFTSSQYYQVKEIGVFEITE
jgi:hypothetical protein